MQHSLRAVSNIPEPDTMQHDVVPNQSDKVFALLHQTPGSFLRGFCTNE